MTDELETKRKRALFRATHRGTMEMDWLLGRYAEAMLNDMDDERLAYFERFLAEPDPELQNLILGRVKTEGYEFAELIEEIRTFHNLEAANNTSGR